MCCCTRAIFSQRVRIIVGLFGVMENLTISKIVYRQNSDARVQCLSRISITDF